MLHELACGSVISCDFLQGYTKSPVYEAARSPVCTGIGESARQGLPVVSGLSVKKETTSPHSNKPRKEKNKPKGVDYYSTFVRISKKNIFLSLLFTWFWGNFVGRIVIFARPNNGNKSGICAWLFATPKASRLRRLENNLSIPIFFFANFRFLFSNKIAGKKKGSVSMALSYHITSYFFQYFRTFAFMYLLLTRCEVLRIWSIQSVFYYSILPPCDEHEVSSNPATELMSIEFPPDVWYDIHTRGGFPRSQ